MFLRLCVRCFSASSSRSSSVIPKLPWRWCVEASKTLWVFLIQLNIKYIVRLLVICCKYSVRYLWIGLSCQQTVYCDVWLSAWKRHFGFYRRQGNLWLSDHYWFLWMSLFKEVSRLFRLSVLSTKENYVEKNKRNPPLRAAMVLIWRWSSWQDIQKLWYSIFFCDNYNCHTRIFYCNV